MRTFYQIQRAACSVQRPATPQPGEGGWSVAQRASRPSLRRTSNIERVNAFTLIELLLVIAIISILAALLAPALRAARDEARSTKCLHNLHQVSEAIFLYANDNNGKFPFWDELGTWNGTYLEWDGVGSGSSVWQNYVGIKYLGEPPGGSAFYTKSAILNSTLHCPSDQTVDGSGNPVRDIGINGTDYPGYGWWTSWPAPSGATGADVAGFKNPSQTDLIMDCHDATPPNGGEWGQSSHNTFLSSASDLPYYCRHHNGFNAVFVDGHGEWKSGAWLLNILQEPSPQNDVFFDWTNQW